MGGSKISRGRKSQKWGVNLILLFATKLWQGNVLTPVCDSVHGLSHPPGQTSPRQTPHGCLPPAQCMLGYTHPYPAQCMLGYMSPLAATAADGTHPTGMLSCLNLYFHLFPGGSNARCGASIYYLAKVLLEQ